MPFTLIAPPPNKLLQMRLLMSHHYLIYRIHLAHMWKYDIMVKERQMSIQTLTLVCLSASYSAVTVWNSVVSLSLAFPFRAHKSFVFTVRVWWGFFNAPQCIVNAFGERICGSSKLSLILSVSVWDTPQFDPSANLGQDAVCIIIISLCWRQGSLINFL